MAPVVIHLGPVTTIEDLFSELVTACELRPNEVKRVTAVSVKYCWNGVRKRLRKGQMQDLEFFSHTLMEAWENGGFRFEGECHIEMMI